MDEKCGEEIKELRHNPHRPTNQVPSEDSARMKGKETEQKIPNQSVFRNTLNVSNIDTSLT